MAIRDRYGLPLSTSSPAAAERYLEGLDLLLSMNFGSEDAFRRAAAADEGFALAHAGLSEMLMIRAELDEAKASAERATALASGISRWERQHVEAVSLYVNGKGSESLVLIREHLDEFPRDASLLRLANRLFILVSCIRSTVAKAGHAGDLVSGLGPYQGLGVFVGDPGSGRWQPPVRRCSDARPGATAFR